MKKDYTKIAIVGINPPDLALEILQAKIAEGFAIPIVNIDRDPPPTLSEAFFKQDYSKLYKPTKFIIQKKRTKG